jgi:hypothetical protein
VSETEFQLQAQEFIKQLKHYPRVGKRPFGYPKAAWWMSGTWGFLAVLLQIPIVFSEDLERGAVMASLFGVLLFSLGFTMRVVAYTSAASGAMDRWLHEQMEVLERQSENKGFVKQIDRENPTSRV